MFTFPEELRYSSEHVWIRSERGGRAAVGVTQVVVALLGQPEEVEFLAAEGEIFEAGQALVRLSTDEDEWEVLSPLKGQVVEFNVDLADSPEMVGEDPFEEGWLLVIKTTEQELARLLSPEDYQDFVEEEMAELAEELEEEEEENELDLDEEDEDEY